MRTVAGSFLLVIFLVFTVRPVAAGQPSVSDTRYAHLARGVNLTRWFQYGGRVSIKASDRDLLQNAGFTSVRIAVAPQYLLPRWASPATIAKNLGNLDTGIDLFLNAGMAVMLDFQADAAYRSLIRSERISNSLAESSCLAAARECRIWSYSVSPVHPAACC